MAGNGDRGDYGGPEEPTPAEPGRSKISDEARALANLGLEYHHAAICCWDSARLLDSMAGTARTALLAKLVGELSAVLDATNRARAALEKKMEGR